jgi:hypothetical protein
MASKSLSSSFISLSSSLASKENTVSGVFTSFAFASFFWSFASAFLFNWVSSLLPSAFSSSTSLSFVSLVVLVLFALLSSSFVFTASRDCGVLSEVSSFVIS